MASPLSTMFGMQLKSWFSTKGFAMVAAAALFPALLTGAWVATHQADLEVVELTMDKTVVHSGDQVNLTALVRSGAGSAGDFNVTISVLGFRVVFSGGQVVGELTPAAGGTEQTHVVEGLRGGAEERVTATWNATQPGIYYVFAFADREGEVNEMEEFNNLKELNDRTPQPDMLVVRPATPAAADAPAPPVSLNGTENASAQVDLAITTLELSPQDLEHGQDAVVRATVTNRGTATADNVTLHVRAGQVFSGFLSPRANESRTFTLAPGASESVEVTWARPDPGAYWAQAYAVPGPDVAEATPDDNQEAQAFTVAPAVPEGLVPAIQEDARFKPFLEVQERGTIKNFYRDIFEVLHLVIIIPFISLFYAGGVLADERERGNLTYLLTRPMPKWGLPVTKFVASYMVAAVAVVIGLLVTFFLLFGRPGTDVGFLTTPLLASLVALFVYGGFFTLLGVLVPTRPYLVGVGFVLGWEVVASLFVPWVHNLTIRQHILNALELWSFEGGVQWLPAGEEGLRALLVVVVAGLAFLGAALYAIQTRDLAEA